MKKVFTFLLSVSLISTSSYASPTSAAVKQSFDKKFPAPTQVRWGKESVTEWEADFTLNGKPVSANFSQDGA